MHSNVEKKISDVVIKKLREQQANRDQEEAHRHSDDILCEFLCALGYSNVAAEYDKIEKWYS